MIILLITIFSTSIPVSRSIPAEIIVTHSDNDVASPHNNPNINKISTIFPSNLSVLPFKIGLNDLLIL